MSINTVIKSDGTVVPFDPNKVNKWAEYASDNGVPWSDIALKAFRKCYDNCRTSDIQQAMIDACVEMEDTAHLKMAGRILLGSIYKEAHGGFKHIPTLKEFYKSMIERDLWVEMDYTDEELDELESVIDHSKNLSANYSYTSLKQMRDKYLSQDLISRKCHESPQFMFMGVALQSMMKEPKEERLEHIRYTYEYLSDLKINLSTPMLVNLRTPNKGLASCCVYTTQDTADSLATGDHIAYMMTCASAGIGSHLTTRSKGDPIRHGSVVHQGKLPYLRMIESAVHANKQACYDDQTEVLTNRGFVFFKDVMENDLIAQVDDNGATTWHKPLAQFEYDFKGELVSFKRGEKEFLVTDNHKMVIARNGEFDGSLDEDEDLGNVKLLEFVEAGDLEINDNTLFMTNAVVGKADSRPLEAWEMLYLFIVARRNPFSMSKNVEIDIGEYEEHFVHLCDLYGDKITPIVDGKGYVSNSKVIELQLAFHSNLPNQGKGTLDNFLEYLQYITNGNVYNAGGVFEDLIQMIATLTGRDITIEFNEDGGKMQFLYEVLYDRSSFIRSTAFDKGLVPYEGKVYCLEVPTNRLIVRRDGETLVCGNSRGGANTTYFSILDPEIEDLIVLKNPTTVLQKRIRNIDYAVNVNKYFGERVAKNEDWFTISYYYAKDLHDAFYSADYELFKELYHKYENHEHATKYKARDLAVKFLTESVETGRLYIHYVDEANHHTPFNDAIYSSNLCIAGDQIVPTDKGLFTAKELYDMGDEILTFDGEKINKTSSMKLREVNVPTYKITLSNGMTHTVTDYHKVMTDRGLVACKDLEVGVDKVKINVSKGIFGKRSDMKDEAFLLGLFHGDGGTSSVTSTGKEIIHIDLYEGSTLHLLDAVDRLYAKYDAGSNHEGMEGRVHDAPSFHLIDKDKETHKKARLSSSRMLSRDLGFKKGVIPTWLKESDMETQLEYIKGVFITDGTYSYDLKANANYLSLTSTDKEWLEYIQAMLNNMGMNFGLYGSAPAGLRQLPDGRGGSKDYACKASYRLVSGLTSTVLRFDELTGFVRERGHGSTIDDILVNKRMTKDREYQKVLSIEYVKDQDVYCPTVDSEEHLFVSNCFITKNCSEIELPTKGFTDVMDLYSDDPFGEIGLCSLSSLVLGRITDEEYENVAHYVVRLVDNTIDLMDYPFTALRRTARARRSIGIGMTNLAHDLASRGLSYTSQEGKQHIYNVAERHAYYLYKASLRLGREKGNAEWMYKTKYPQGWTPVETYNRNVDDVIEPTYRFDWNQLSREIKANGGIRNSTLIAIPPNESSSQLTNTTNSVYPVRSLKVIKTSGTGRNILLAPDYDTLRDKYDIAWNVPSKDLIEAYAIIQKFTDQGISPDLYVSYKDSAVVSARTLLTDFLYMMKLGCKSRYYINSQSGVDAENAEKDGAETIDGDAFCESCVL